MKSLIVIPTLNEAQHIQGVIASVVDFADANDVIVVVADGGSVDGTRQIVTDLTKTYGWLRLMDNPNRFQSAAVNLAVDAFAQDRDWLIRLDAHALYPEGFITTLIQEAHITNADNVVVSMLAKGHTKLQKLIAISQNSRFGNGGSAHRNMTEGVWVDHGHHALFRLGPFREVGGYDPSFSHNEDAELDFRLIRAKFRIWLTAKTFVTYFPRTTLRSLFMQYRNFGIGRARTITKHQMRPATRQKIVIGLLPATLLSVLTPLTWLAMVPVLVWGLGCLAAGVMIALNQRDLRAVAAGPIAGLMQFAWSVGFWHHLFSRPRKREG